MAVRKESAGSAGALFADGDDTGPGRCHIVNYRFEPPTVSIGIGGSVRWINGEKRTRHSVVFPDESDRGSERLFPGEHWKRRFDRPGRYAHPCGPYPEMKGEVLVGE